MLLAWLETSGFSRETVTSHESYNKINVTVEKLSIKILCTIKYSYLSDHKKDMSLDILLTTYIILFYFLFEYHVKVFPPKLILLCLAGSTSCPSYINHSTAALRDL